MLAGTKAFDGTDATEMIAAVVRGEPAWAALPKDTPPGVVTVMLWVPSLAAILMARRIIGGDAFAKGLGG